MNRFTRVLALPLVTLLALTTSFAGGASAETAPTEPVAIEMEMLVTDIDVAQAARPGTRW